MEWILLKKLNLLVPTVEHHLKEFLFNSVKFYDFNNNYFMNLNYKNYITHLKNLYFLHKIIKL